MSHSNRGFTLIELLIVMSIIILMSGIILTNQNPAGNGAMVKHAAHELAATIRQVRSRAMATNTFYGISFNITNAPGTSGRLINNWSGGHWYRVIGPDRMSTETWNNRGNTPPMPPRADRRGPIWSSVSPSLTIDNPFTVYLQQVSSAWMSETTTLPPRKVRFLALSDQDNGNFKYCSASSTDSYKNPLVADAHYPRPWFGQYDPGTKRLRPWGGYDPTVKDFKQTSTATPTGPRNGSNGTVSYSGFFYEGSDGEISDCQHPKDRAIIDDLNLDLRWSITAEKDTPTRLLWKQGDARPLVNGEWLDCLLLFFPDGRIFKDTFMKARREWGYGNSNFYFEFGKNNIDRIGPGDMCSNMSPNDNMTRWDNQSVEAIDYNLTTGMYYITLAPDIKQDSDSFPSVQAALRSITPCYRVAISQEGGVSVTEVKLTLPAHMTIDPAINRSWYHNATELKKSYRNWRPMDRLPITDCITSDMLAKGLWWATP